MRPAMCTLGARFALWSATDRDAAERGMWASLVGSPTTRDRRRHHVGVFIIRNQAAEKRRSRA
jgi:hypothetical protein